MMCCSCGEHYEGDGHKEVFLSPWADEETYRYCEPDSEPVNCGYTDNKLSPRN